MIMNPWVQTQTGLAFDLFNPKIEQVDPVDIAVRLARAARYSGSELRISVAQHSVMAAAAVWNIGGIRWKPSRLRRAQLLTLHDAAETYIGDVFGPARVALKRLCFDLFEKHVDPYVLARLKPDDFDLFSQLERRCNQVIFPRFGIDYDSITVEEHTFIKEYDRRCLFFEKQWFVRTPEPQPWLSAVAFPAFTISDFGGHLDDDKGLERAAVVTESWTETTAIGAFLVLLHRLQLVPPNQMMVGSNLGAAIDAREALDAGKYIIDTLFPA